MDLKLVYANLIMQLKEFYRNKGTMFFVLIFPIILMMLFGFIFQDQGEMSYDLHILNLDGGGHSQNLTEMLGDTDLFNVIEVGDDLGDDLDEQKQYLLDQKANTMLIIPEGYSDDFDAIIMSRIIQQPTNETVTLLMLYDPASSAAMTKVGLLSSMIDGINKEVTGIPDIVELKMNETVSDEFKAIDFFAPGIIAMSIMSTALFGTVGMNTELRQKGILRKLATTPLSRSEWLMGNMLYQLCMAALSTASIIIIGMVIFGLRPHINLFLALFVILNAFTFSGIGMLITRFVKDADGVQAAANAVMFPMLFLSGTFYPLETMPDFLQSLARFLPLYYVNEGMRAAMITLDEGTLLSSAVVLVVLAIVIFVLGVILTSWKHD